MILREFMCATAVYIPARLYRIVFMLHRSIPTWRNTDEPQSLRKESRHPDCNRSDPLGCSGSCGSEELGGKKVKAEQVPAATRITNQLKSAALRGKVSTDELAAIAELANALKVFIK